MPNPILLTDDWLTSFKKGEQEAFKVFYKETIKYAKWDLQDREWLSEADWEEIAAEGYYRIFKKRDQFVSYEHAIQYLRTIWKNLSIEVFRRGRRWILLSPSVLRDELDMNPLDAYEEKKDHESKLQLLHKAIQKLTPMRRKIMEALFVDGMNKFEVAQLFGIKPQTVINFKTLAIDDLMLRCLGYKAKRTYIHIKGDK